MHSHSKLFFPLIFPRFSPGPLLKLSSLICYHLWSGPSGLRFFFGGESLFRRSLLSSESLGKNIQLSQVQAVSNNELSLWVHFHLQSPRSYERIMVGGSQANSKFFEHPLNFHGLCLLRELSDGGVSLLSAFCPPLFLTGNHQELNSWRQHSNKTHSLDTD